MGFSTMLMGKGFDQPRNSVKQIVEYLIENPFRTESQIQEDIWGYFRNAPRQLEPNKKYADLLRRGLQKGLYKRILWKRKSDSRNLYRYYVPTSVKENFLKNN
jgi:hypothetical protein